MKLRTQMLLVSALTLVVPFVGWQSVKQLYIALQQARIDEQTIEVASLRLALSDADISGQWLQTRLDQNSSNNWYAETSRYPLFVDGYDDDWKNLQGAWQYYPDVSTNQNSIEQSPPPTSVAFSQREVVQESNLLRFRSAVSNQRLYVFMQVADSSVVFHRLPFLNPDAGEGELPDRWKQLVNGDSVEIAIKRGNNRFEHALLRVIAPGSVDVIAASDHGRHAAGDRIPGWEAHWEATSTGYQLEVSLPVFDNGSPMAISVIDVDRVDEPRSRWVGSMSPQSMRRWVTESATMAGSVALLRASESLAQWLSVRTQDGARIRIFDVHGWLVSDVNRLYTSADDDIFDAQLGTFDGVLDAVLFRLFSMLVADDLPLAQARSDTVVALNLSEAKRSTVEAGQSLTSRYVTVENDRVLGSLAAIGQGAPRAYLLYEANEEHYTAYTGSRLARIFGLLLLVSLLAGCGLLVFAFVLSSRIQRLSSAAQAAVNDDGRVGSLRVSAAHDEIGDLSRQLSSLLARSANYTQYLEALSGRLSHELRTPLSVVRTSLENIDKHALDEQTITLIQRAEGGADTLGRIIKALVESARLEQSVACAEVEQLDLVAWITESAALYEQVYSGQRFETHIETTDAMPIKLSPELLRQGLDKLIDNAISFATEPTIRICLSSEGKGSSRRAVLIVANRGAAIDEADALSLFDPLVSKRDKPEEGQMHLGLGLYMVRLISEASGGNVVARNQDGWVLFGLSLPMDR